MITVLNPPRSVMRKKLSGVATAAVVCLVSSAALAGSITYTPNNPSFGGNPNNGANLLALANAQNLPLARQTADAAAQAAARTAAGSGTGTGALTAGQVFAQQLQAQLLSSFANQITQAIFGANAQTSGNFAFGGTSINFQRVGNQVNIAINDGVTITNITVPVN